MPRQLGHLSQGGVLPHQDLVLRVAVGAHLCVCVWGTAITSSREK